MLFCPKLAQCGDASKSLQPRLVVQRGHANKVNAITLSPDGRMMATASDDHTVILRSVVANRTIGQLVGHRGPVLSVQFSPDAKSILTGGADNTVRLWDVATQKQLRVIPGFRWGKFQPNNRFKLNTATLYLFDGKSNFVIRNVDAKIPPERILKIAEDVTSLAVSNDGTLLAVLTKGGQLETYQTSSGKKNFTGRSGPFALGEQGKIATVQKQNRLRIHGPKPFAYNFQRKVSHLSFAKTPGWETSLAVGFESGEVVLLLDQGDGKTAFRNIGRVPGTVTDLHVLSLPFGDDLIAASSSAGTGHVWTSDAKLHAVKGRVLNNLNHVSIRNLPKATVANTVDAVSAEMNSKLLATRKAVMNDLNGKSVSNNVAFAQAVHSVALSPTEPMMAVACGRTVKLWDLRTGALIWSRGNWKRIITTKGECVTKGFCATHVAFSSDGRRIIVADGLNQQLRELAMLSGKTLRWNRDGPPREIVQAMIKDKRWSRLRSELTLAFRGEISTDGKRLVPVGGLTDGKTPYQPGHPNAYFVTKRGDLTVELTRSVGGSGIVGVPHLITKEKGKPEPLSKGNDSATSTWPPDGINPDEYLYDATNGHFDYVTCATISDDGKTIFTGGRDNLVVAWDVATRKPKGRFFGHVGPVRSIGLIPKTKVLYSAGHDGTVRFWHIPTRKELGNLTIFADDSWAFTDDMGRYDASNCGEIDGMHWIVGREIIALAQLKHRYFDPGLLAKHLGFGKEPLRDVKAFRDVKLFPRIFAFPPRKGTDKTQVTLYNQGGGIGKVQILVNGRELLADARGAKINPNAQKVTIPIDLTNAPTLFPGKVNEITIVAYNAEGYLFSRGLKLRYISGGDAQKYKPNMYAIVCGVSDYGGSDIDLRYAAKDAEDIAKALKLAGSRFLEPHAGKVHLTLLATSDHPDAILPTRKNLELAFAAATKAGPDDILVVYLAGHGTTLQQGSDLYCYLTKDARTLDPATLSDKEVLSQVAVTSEELTKWIKNIPAKRCVLVLDTCAAGAAAIKLTEKRYVPADQVRALDRLKDRTGFHVLMGCAADRVSYEATQFAQGLLTYSLLEGMRGTALREGEYVDVTRLFSHAVDRVPELAGQVGGVQRPLVAAPRGSSFDIGRLTDADRPNVPLALVRPLVLEPRLLDPEALEDHLKLEKLLAKKLLIESMTVRGMELSLVYVPTNDFPGAVRPTGTYTVSGKNITVRVLLKRDGKALTRLEIKGTTDNIPGLVNDMAKHITKAVQKAE